MKYNIWSIEHKAWWNPNKMGYTTDRNSAGDYSLDDAVSICLEADLIKNNEPNEAMVPIFEK